MKISTTNVRKKDGTKLVNGYKIALKKSDIDRINMHEGTELVPTFEDGIITLKEVGRFFPECQTENFLICICYRKLSENLYTDDVYSFNTGSETAEDILDAFHNRPLPADMITRNQKGEAELNWHGKKYKLISIGGTKMAK